MIMYKNKNNYFYRYITSYLENLAEVQSNTFKKQVLRPNEATLDK